MLVSPCKNGSYRRERLSGAARSRQPAVFDCSAHAESDVDRRRLRAEQERAHSGGTPAARFSNDFAVRPRFSLSDPSARTAVNGTQPTTRFRKDRLERNCTRGAGRQAGRFGFSGWCARACLRVSPVGALRFSLRRASGSLKRSILSGVSSFRSRLRRSPPVQSRTADTSVIRAVLIRAATVHPCEAQGCVHVHEQRVGTSCWSSTSMYQVVHLSLIHI